MDSKGISFPKKPFRTFGGINAEHHKNTANTESVIMPCPEQVVITMNQNIGAPCKPLVKAGDSVTVGQLIADSNEYVSAPIHSSISGTVLKVTTVKDTDNSPVEAIIIKSDGLMTPCPTLKPQNADTLEGLLKAARESGLVGLGPTPQ